MADDLAPPPAEAPTPEAAAPEPEPAPVGLLASPERFFNRELSWLAFNHRVLEEAENRRHPLLERVRFVSISANNLDEFFMVRVAGLKGQVREGVRVVSQDGLTPAEIVAATQAEAAGLMREQQRIWRELRPELAEAGLELVDPAALTIAELDRLEPIFQAELFPVLTPLAIDPAHPFPFLPNLSFSEALKLRRRADGKTFYALTPLPTQLRRFWHLPPDADTPKGCKRIIALEDLVLLFIERLFPQAAMWPCTARFRKSCAEQRHRH